MGREKNLEFQEAIEKRRILPFTQGRKLVGKEIKSAREDLKEAEDRYANKRYKYATVTAYYAAFHAGRALIYSRGYREKSHYYLIVALQSLFVVPFTKFGNRCLSTVSRGTSFAFALHP